MSSWLFIDSSTAGTYRFGVFEDARQHMHQRAGRTQGLLSALEKEIGRDVLSTVDGICVVSGPGSFSAVRAGVLVANLLARLFQKPLVGVRVDDAMDLARLAHDLERGVHSAVRFVDSLYDAEPNITLPKTLQIPHV